MLSLRQERDATSSFAESWAVRQLDVRNAGVVMGRGRAARAIR